jgi:hypothetical protein
VICDSRKERDLTGVLPRRTGILLHRIRAGAD